MTRGLYLTSDLFFSSRVTSLARESGWTLDVAASPEDAIAKGDQEGLVLLLVDLSSAAGDLAELLATLRARHADLQVVAYGPHVDEQMLAAARQAGCDEVLTRGQFNQTSSEILRRYLGNG